MKKILTAISALLLIVNVWAEDGSRLWLRYPADASNSVTVSKSSATTRIAEAELQKSWKGAPVKCLIRKDKSLKKDGFRIYKEHANVVITSPSDKGVLYGAYHLLRMQQCGVPVEGEIIENPAYDVRILNHWDNLDGTIERGYAGHSLWRWEELPQTISPRYEAYARANASIGINATVINNVNASPQILSVDYLQKVKALAQVFRPYGIRVFLSINFSSPSALGNLPTSDPMDKAVIAWWRQKVKEIYSLIPDFGGFLVKANSEGLPGPQDYGRSHSQGANMLADALKPYNGIVMWRAFVYKSSEEDRAKQAYQEFLPLDGEFRENVIVQIKNGPVDFQPREPFSPLFGAMKKTPVMAELQITQEYTGFSNHLCFLAPMWREFLFSDTRGFGSQSKVAGVTQGKYYPFSFTAIAGVANTGDNVNWCGHHFAQSNWYAFGRLAWNPELTDDCIAREWLLQSFGGENFDKVITPLAEMMLQSREAVVEYMMPMGLHHLFAWGHHYGPEPWCRIDGARPDWLPSYYHKADSSGIGFDRSRSGSDAVSQYEDSICAIYNNVETCPENLLLWFHHLNWNHKMKNGNTLWFNLCDCYNRGAAKTVEFQRTWTQTKGVIDEQRYAEVEDKLKTQTRDAAWWRDACLLYFATFSAQPIPSDMTPAIHNLKDMMEFKLEITNFEVPDSGFSK